MKRIFTVESYRAGRPIDEVKRERGLKTVIKLASNESPCGPSPRVLAAITRAAREVNRYPDGGCFTLRRDLAKALGCREGQLVFGNGSDEVIVCAVRAFVGEGDEVVVAKPSFLIYDIATRLVGGKVKAVPLVDFRYDLKGMLRAVTARTKIVFIANPDNPAGTYIAKKELEDFIRRCRKDVLIFIDEAYYEFVRRPDYPQTLGWLKKYPNLIVTRTFSKMYGLAGLRIGYGVAQEEIVDILNRLREPFNVNSLAQAAAVACLKDRAYYRRVARELERQRQQLHEGLRAQGLTFVETVTNFILIDVRQDSSAVCERLLQQGVIVRDMRSWGMDRYIRVTIGTDAENKMFLQALKRAL